MWDNSDPPLPPPSPLLPPPPPPPPRRAFGAWAALGQTLLILVAQNIIGGVAAAPILLSRAGGDVQKLSATGLAHDGFFLAIASLVTLPVCVALVYAFANMLPGTSVREYLGLSAPRLRVTLLWLLLTFVYLAADTAANQLTHRPISSFMLDTYRSARVLPLLVLALVVVAPVSEELLFRGLLFRGLQHSWGPVAAVLITAVFWAGMHLQYDLFDITSIFIAGTLLGVARLKSGSLYVTMWMHALVNLMGVIQVALYLHAGQRVG